MHFEKQQLDEVRAQNHQEVERNEPARHQDGDHAPTQKNAGSGPPKRCQSDRRLHGQPKDLPGAGVHGLVAGFVQFLPQLEETGYLHFGDHH